MWTNDSKRILLEHFDEIHNSPCYLYHYALPFCPSSSWLHEYYTAELSQGVRVVKSLSEGWGMCARTVPLDSILCALSFWNNTIAVGSTHKDILILDAITGSQTAVLYGHTAGVISLAFLPDGTSLVSGSYDGTAKLWDIQTGGVVKTFSHEGSVCSVSISADNTTIASGSNGSGAEVGTIYLWNIQTGACHKTIQQEGRIHHAIFSPKDPQTLISVSGGIVQQWNIGGHKVGPAYAGYHVSFSPDGTQLILDTGYDIRIQTINPIVVMAKLYKPGGICCFSPDGRRVAVVSDMMVTIWDITGPDPHFIGDLVGHTCQGHSSP